MKLKFRDRARRRIARRRSSSSARLHLREPLAQPDTATSLVNGQPQTYCRLQCVPAAQQKAPPKRAK